MPLFSVLLSHWAACKLADSDLFSAILPGGLVLQISLVVNHTSWRKDHNIRLIPYTPVYFISNRFISNQAQIPENLSNFYATAEAEIVSKLSNLMLKPFHKSQRVLIYAIQKNNYLKNHTNNTMP